MKTNELNYASLEASKRLVKAGIVLETDSIWFLGVDSRWYFSARWLGDKLLKIIPAPSMAEVWRELPGDTTAKKFSYISCFLASASNEISTNPTDALIDLLIWQKGEKK